ncbi:CLN3 family protein [Megaselia abdita]
MLSAAHDIIKQFEKEDDGTGVHNDRQCNIVSTGAILLADIIPSLMVKIVAPYIPFWVNIRVFLAILLQIAGFLLVAFAEAEWMAILGVIATSASSGIGETTFMAYTGKFNKNVISTWSSGTGGAGVIGSLSYAGLISAGLSPKNTMLVMLAFPAIESFAFWVVLRKPSGLYHEYQDSKDASESTRLTWPEEEPLVTWKDKLMYSGQLMKYMIPLTTVYLFEYFINQGMFELVYFENIFLDKESQYRWLNVDYQIGVFISRSSVNLLTINKLWLLSVFQLVNVVYFLFEVIYFFTPSIWIIFAIVFWEGLLGGGAYVNTFYKMSKEVHPVRREFAMGCVVQSDSFGIALAGFLSMPVHNAICSLPKPIRL